MCQQMERRGELIGQWILSRRVCLRTGAGAGSDVGENRSSTVEAERPRDRFVTS